MLPFFSRLLRFPEKNALTWRVAGHKKHMTYQELLLQSQCSAIRVMGALDRFTRDNPDISMASVMCKSPQSHCVSHGRIPLLDVGTQNFVTGMLGTWMAGYASVPLCASHPPPQWEYFLQDSVCHAAFFHSSFKEDIMPLLSMY